MVEHKPRHIANQLIAAMILLSHICLCTASELPDLGSPSEAVITQKQKKILGMKFEASIHKYLPIIHDPIINDYIRSMVQRLLPGANLAGERVKVFVAGNNTVNALAGPGNIIVLNTGTMLTAKNQSQLAAVLAHELGHLSHRHLYQSIAQQRILNWSTLIGILATIAAGAAGGTQAAEGTMASVMAASHQSMVNYTRSQEQEADNTSLRLLYQAGYDPRQMPAFFETMSKNSYQAYDIPQFLQTHPVHASRIASTRQLADQYPEVKQKTSLLFLLVQERARVLTHSNDSEMSQYYKQRLNNNHTLQQQAIQYGYALVLKNAGNYKEAAHYAERLYNRHPETSYYALLYSSILDRLGKHQQALTIINEQRELYPDSMPISYRYVELLMRQQHYQKAISALQNLLNDDPDNAELQQVLAKAYHERGQPVRSKRILAQAYAQQQRWDLAALQLKQLLTNNQVHGEQKEVVRAQLERYQKRDKSLTRMLNNGSGL